MRVLFLGFVALLSLSCASVSRHPNEFISHDQSIHNHGGRIGLHGMVLYGSKGKYFLDHIPMENAPHDLQIIAEVLLKDNKGKILSHDFSLSAFTLKPLNHFSLDDLVSQHLKTFKGSIYNGGFEQGGQLIKEMSEIVIEVVSIKHARKIPSTSINNEIEIIGNGDIFQVNEITPERNFQEIRNKKTGDVLWCVKGPDFYEAC